MSDPIKNNTIPSSRVYVRLLVNDFNQIHDKIRMLVHDGVPTGYAACALVMVLLWVLGHPPSSKATDIINSYYIIISFVLFFEII